MPLLGKSVDEIMAWPPHIREYWINRAIATMNQEAEKERLYGVWLKSQH